MKIWLTQLKAINPINNQLTTFCGPNIKALTHQMAYDFCQENGLGYLEVLGELCGEIPCVTTIGEDGIIYEYSPDFSRMIDYEVQNNN